ncbi:putative PLAC8 motif-containing protein [Helianthus anomalus]
MPYPYSRKRPGDVPMAFPARFRPHAVPGTGTHGSKPYPCFIASAEACNELMAYSLILSCCCYTCCVRRKLRKTLDITGGWCDDFLSHVMCCCCALVQELREVEMRGIHGMSHLHLHFYYMIIGYINKDSTNALN